MLLTTLNPYAVEVEVTLDQTERAYARYNEHENQLLLRGQKHLKNSIEEGRGTFIGLMGEEIIRSYFPDLPWDYSPSSHPYDYDLQLVDQPRLTADVKTKKQTKLEPPLSYYFASVCDKNTAQKCDMYWFLRVHEKGEFAWINGCLPKKLFFKQAVFYRLGELDPTSHCGWRFKEDCWNVPIENLWHPTSTAEMLEMFDAFKASESR